MADDSGHSNAGRALTPRRPAACTAARTRAACAHYNERLVLSLVRRHGSLAKTEIARMTGLSAQTVSVIMRATRGRRAAAARRAGSAAGSASRRSRCRSTRRARSSSA